LQQSIDYMQANPETALNRFKGFKDYEVDKVRRLLEWAKGNLNTDEEQIAMSNFSTFFTEHDRRRNTDINKTFPQMKNFIQRCEAINARR
jgi:hypothetical protein